MPEAGGTMKGGGSLTIEWEDSGETPALDTLLSYQLFLCAGGNEAGTYIPVKTLVPTGQFSTGNTASSTVEVGLGESVENAYFIKMISTAPGGSVVNYSPRFSISGMTGTFPETVTAGLATVDGTDGPPTENNIQSNQQGGGNAPGVDGDYGITYTMQTGAMRFAPMPKNPPTKITAGKNPKPIYPTSAVQFAATKMAIPTQKTTVTQSLTFSVESAENTVAAAAQPTDGAMQKFLNRWKD
ncbi:hypothetical protein EPUS_05511 [Endocarpon pusillum Z07020]|uniref:Uncharacterized protein n=1 Tax=Endocarpon pusillum (strain Z07020 / HMAS-L-300199) TaxID=1263415 RepID=U1G8M7_ENDPU|nr:uncharacterized protein EPUS_05511 [Endocarpon pusillum Z07020]ERF73807.1 hypothetical protein EPUS_05511 [Endocarpon pusillum Z07020]